jgi:hypothetical protein
VLVVSPYLSPETRVRLRQAGAGFLDLTGNARLHLARPLLAVDSKGAEQAPSPGERPVPSLRGAKVGALIRVLVEFREPGSVRETAERAGVDPGYASRVLAVLEQDGLLARARRGKLEKIDWANLLRRWALEAPLPSRVELTRLYEPRGLPRFLDRLARSGFLHAITGPMAACQQVPGVAPEAVFLYVHDVAGAIEQFGLHPVQAGNPANVVLLRPEDILVFARADTVNGLSYAAPAQVAADLLSSPTGAAHAEQLLAWMAQHEAEWRR